MDDGKLHEWSAIVSHGQVRGFSSNLNY